MGELVGQAALVAGHILQVDGLLQQHLPLDPRTVVSLHRVDDLGHTHTHAVFINPLPMVCMQRSLELELPEVKAHSKTAEKQNNISCCGMVVVLQ